MSIYSSYSDEQLIALLKVSDEAAFTEIYNRYWKPLLYKAGKKLNEILLAEEIVQDIFTDLWNRRNSLEIGISLSSYLQAATKYRIINIRLKRYREKEYLRSQTQGDPPDHSTEQTIQFEELKDRLAALVDALPQHCKIVYQLHKEEGFSHKEVSKTLSISEKTVQYHLNKALRSLRTGLSQFFFSFF